MISANTPQFKLGGTLFRTKAEQFVLILPIFFFIGIGFDLIQSTQYSPQEKSLGLFVSQFIFLNHIHVCFTFFLTFSIPEVRQWLAEKRPQAPSLATLLAVFFVSIYLYWAIAVPYLRKTSPESAVVKASIIAVILVGTYHNFIQSLGLSLAYNRIIENSNPEWRTDVRRWEGDERRFAWALMAIALFRNGVLLFFQDQPGAVPMALRWSLAAMTFAACFAAIGSAARTPQSSDRAKTIYSLRYLFIPLAPFSDFAYWGMLSCHGVEYLFVTLKIRENSTGARAQPWIRLALYGAIVIAFLPLKIVHEEFIALENVGAFLSSNWVVTYLVPLTLVASYSHYFIDGFLFKFSNPRTRQMMAPLLLSKPRS